MRNLRFLQLGWVIACAFIGVSLAGGFQGSTDKIGVVDISKVIDQSDFGKAGQDSFNKMKTSRQDLLEFVDTYRVLTMDQANRLKELALKPALTKEEGAEQDRIKADVIATDKRSKELATKANITAEERTLMEDYARRSQAMSDVTTRWYREFMSDMQTWADKQRLDSLQHAREAIQQVAKDQGYTVVFEVGVAPYGSNDLSDATLKAMNAKK